MSRPVENAFTFHSLERFTLLQRLAIRTAGFGLYLFVRLIGATLRFETIGQENLEKIEGSGRLPIYAFWHDRIIAGTYFFRNQRIIVLSSQSFDSEYTARCIQRLGYGIVKGSSSKRAVAGLVGMIRMMKKGYAAAFTLDGPRGPRYEVKMGPVILAQKTGNPLLPFVVECRKSWRLRSWDRLNIPKPFTQVAVIFGEPIYVEPGGDGAALSSKRAELQASLDALVESGAQWRGGHLSFASSVI